MARIITVAQPAPENCRGMKVEELSADNEISGKDGPLTLDMNTPPARRLILEFDEETAGSMRAAIDQGCDLCLKDNTFFVGYETNRYSSEWPLTVCPDNPDAFYVDYNETDFLYGNEDLFYYNLTHDTLSRPYNYCKTDEILWEDPEESTSSGSNQCREDDLNSSFLFFQLSSYNKPSADERSQVRMLLLRRLDLLSSPYAYGQTLMTVQSVSKYSPRGSIWPSSRSSRHAADPRCASRSRDLLRSSRPDTCMCNIIRILPLSKCPFHRKPRQN